MNTKICKKKRIKKCEGDSYGSAKRVEVGYTKI